MTHAITIRQHQEMEVLPELFPLEMPPETVYFRFSGRLRNLPKTTHGQGQVAPSGPACFNLQAPNKRLVMDSENNKMKMKMNPWGK